MGEGGRRAVKGRRGGRGGGRRSVSRRLEEVVVGGESGAPGVGTMVSGSQVNQRSERKGLIKLTASMS